jgi:hypothetical protein
MGEPYGRYRKASRTQGVDHWASGLIPDAIIAWIAAIHRERDIRFHSRPDRAPMRLLPHLGEEFLMDVADVLAVRS